MKESSKAIIKGLDLSAQSNDELERYNSLINTINGFEEYTLDENGTIISSNLEIANITGYEEFELIGTHISVLYDQSDAQSCAEDLEKAKRLRHIVVNGIRLKKKGQTFWAKMKINAIYSDENTFRGFKVVLQDTTHRALSNLRIRTIKDEYLSILNNPFIGIVKFRISDLAILMLNQKSKEILGEPDDERNKLNLKDWFDSSGELMEFTSLLKRGRRVERFLFCARNKATREVKYLEISVRCYHMQDFAEGVVFDVTERQFQLQELKRLNSDLDNFTYHASHDLRAPLTTILGLVNLSSKEQSVEEMRHYLQLIQERVIHLDILLKDLIAVTYNNKSPLTNTEIDFQSEIELVMKEVEMFNHAVHLDLQISHKKPFISDQVRVRTILRNLISNAYKYQREDITHKYIRLHINVKETYVAMQLQDNGIGIDFNFKEKIFNMFVRATTKSSGTGLGLYIVKSMLEKLGGFISLESTLNEGTTILVIIPNQATK